MTFDYLVIVIASKLIDVALLQMIVWYPVKKSIFFEILKKFQNWNFLKMHHIHMKPVSSLFELRWWSSSQKASKLSCEFKFYIENTARALPRALHAILSTPYRGKFQKSGRTLGGVSARRGARKVVKCTPIESLIKIDAFWLLGHRYSSKNPLT